MTMDPSLIDATVVREIAPTGQLRVALNMGNPILTSSRASGVSPAGVIVDLSREFARRLGVEALFGEFKTAAESLVACPARPGGDVNVPFIRVHRILQAALAQAE